MDDDYNGILDLDELTEGFKIMKVPNAAQEAYKILGLIDFDGNGTIEYREWCTISVDWNEILNKDRIQQLFRIIDQDLSGTISYEELRLIFTQNDGQSNEFGDPISDEFIRNVMEEYDQDKDGMLDVEEFYSIMNGLVDFDKQ